MKFPKMLLNLLMCCCTSYKSIYIFSKILCLFDRCRAEETVFYVGILAPFVITYSFNIILYFIIIGSLSKRLTKKKGDSANKGIQHNGYKKLAIIAFFLAIMFGLAWIFAILVAIPNTTLSYISQYLFSFLVGFQGLLYFIMHGLRSPDARQFWITLFYKPCLNRVPSFLKNWTTMAPHHTTKQTMMRSHTLNVSQDNLISSQDESTLQHPKEREGTDASLSSPQEQTTHKTELQNATCQEGVETKYGEQ